MPIPGFRTVQQVTVTAAALDCGPLTPEQFARIEELIGARDESPAG